MKHKKTRRGGRRGVERDSRMARENNTNEKTPYRHVTGQACLLLFCVLGESNALLSVAFVAQIHAEILVVNIQSHYRS